MDKTIEKYSPEIVSDVKSKKELRALDEDFVFRKLKDFFAEISNYQYKEKILRKIFDSKDYAAFKKSKEHKFLIKNVRAELRKVYGAFILEDYGRKSKILSRIDGPDDLETPLALLKLHKSTSERLKHYEDLYYKILSVFDDSQKITILDLACGMNPVAYFFIKDRIKKYYASDISSEDCAFLREYFSKSDVDSEVFPLDLVQDESLKKLSKIKCDVCFLFKTLDGLERIERNITEKIFKALDTRYIAVTFPTLSLSGVREIKEYRRVWLEKLLDRLGWKWEKVLIENELLYMIEKK